MITKPEPISVYERGDGTDQTLPFNLPEGRLGPYRIETKIEPANTRLCVVSMRNAIFMGLKPCEMRHGRPLVIHKLRYHRRNDEANHGVWMTTLPQEVEQHRRQLKHAHGHVLVGGLGLGLAVGILHDNPAVQSITVIEKSKHVIDLVEPYLPAARFSTKVIHDDLFKWLVAARALGHVGFDFAFYDIWETTGQMVLTTHTMPLRRLSIGLVEQDQIECWNELEMVGQVAIGLSSQLQIPSVIESILVMPEQEFRAMAHMNKESFPFLAWLRAKKHNPQGPHAGAGMRRYVKALCDAEAWQRDWAQYEAKKSWTKNRKKTVVA